jgi:hypothetical protein
MRERYLLEVGSEDPVPRRPESTQSSRSHKLHLGNSMSEVELDKLDYLACLTSTFDARQE